MAMVLDIITKLGINHTVYIQFCIYLVTIFILSKFVFSGYFRSVEERDLRTKSIGDLAGEFHHKTGELHSEYQMKTRETSDQIKNIYEKERSEAIQEYEKVLAKAREEASMLLQKNSQKINEMVTGAMNEIKGQRSQVVLAITSKLLGK